LFKIQHSSFPLQSPSIEQEYPTQESVAQLLPYKRLPQQTLLENLPRQSEFELHVPSAKGRPISIALHVKSKTTDTLDIF
jgi:hypothetical protein